MKDKKQALPIAEEDQKKAATRKRRWKPSQRNTWPVRWDRNIKNVLMTEGQLGFRELWDRGLIADHHEVEDCAIFIKIVPPEVGRRQIQRYLDRIRSSAKPKGGED